MNKFLSGAVTAALLSASAFAQSTITVYVGPNSNTNPTGVYAYDPIPTFEDGCTEAKTYLDLGFEVVLCVFPGTYSTSPTTPYTLPAHGVRVVAFEGTTGVTTMPRLLTNLVFDDLGNTALRPSTVEGISFAGSVELNAGGRVQIRNCEFTFDTSASIGVLISRPADTHSEHVIEFCDFEDDTAGPNQLVGVGNSGVEYLGTSSTLIRANRFANLQQAVYMVGDWFNEEGNISPRIVSNQMSLHERPIDIEYANHAWVVNNSIGSYKAHAGVVSGGPAFGIGFSDCVAVECSNNIVWFAPPTSIDSGDVYVSPASTVLSQWNNYLSDVDPFMTFPRIAATSPLANGGKLSVVLPPADGGPAPISNNAGGTVPVDLSIDFEGDMRITPADAVAGPTVAIGCDQVAEIRLAVVANGGVDAFGNWLADWPQNNPPTLMPVGSFQVQVTGLYPGNSSQTGVVALMGTYFVNSQPSAVNAVDLHKFDSMLGSYTSNLNLVFTGFPQAQSVANGQTTATFTVPATTIPTYALGSRLFLQASSVAPDGTLGVVSNRVPVRVIYNVLSNPL